MAGLNDLPIGDTTELEAAWDLLMEHPEAANDLAIMGVQPDVVSRLFRIAIDSTKEHRRG